MTTSSAPAPASRPRLRRIGPVAGGAQRQTHLATAPSPAGATARCQWRDTRAVLQAGLVVGEVDQHEHVPRRS